MSELKLKYDKARKTDTAKQNEEKKSEPKDDIELYDSPSNARNLCLVLSDGKQVFFNYAYLISGEYFPNENNIRLAFTTHLILLKGHSLESLFDSLCNHEPKRLIVVAERYLEVGQNNEGLITEITVEKLGN